MTSYSGAAVSALNTAHESSHRSSRQRHTKPTAHTSALSLYLQTLSPSGRRAIESMLKTAVSILNSKLSVHSYPWQHVGYQDLVTIKSSMVEQGYSARTINLVISAIRSIVRTGFFQGDVDAHHLLSLNAVKSVRLTGNPAGRALSKREIQRLLQATRQLPTKSAQKRDKALLLVASGSGLRVSELCKLERTDVNLKTGKLTVRSGKGGKFREVVLPIEARQALGVWIKEIKGTEMTGPVWMRITREGKPLESRLSNSGITSIFNRLADLAGIERFSPHDLRR